MSKTTKPAVQRKKAVTSMTLDPEVLAFIERMAVREAVSRSSVINRHFAELMHRERAEMARDPEPRRTEAPATR